MRFLLDTNIVSELSRNDPNPNVLSKFQQHRFAAALAAPVLHELHFGWRRLPEGARRQTGLAFIRELLNAGLEVLPYGRESALLHAEQRARLEAQGAAMSYVDGQIAAIAVHHRLTLVTRNLRDFRRFEQLRAENWFAA